MRATKPIPLIDPLIGAQVGEYRVDGIIGEGGMGVVYRGAHPVIGKQVAIKVLKESLAKNQGLIQRLIEEAKAVNAIAHRNIIDIFGLGELPDGRPYIVMEQLTGEPLDAFLQREGRLGERAATELLLELCQPLEAAHRAGVVHRDLKPGNVFLCDGGDGARFLKLLDFGLARRTGGFGTGSSSQTNRAFIMGTPNYLSPEQANGGDITDRTDVYALGVMLFEFLTGVVPFTGANGLEVAMAHVRQPAPRVSSLVATVSPKLDDLVARMLSKGGPERPSIEEVRRVLAPNAPRPSAPPPPRPVDTGRMERPLTVTMIRPREESGRTKWLVAGALALVVIIGTGAALSALSSEPKVDASPTGTAPTTGSPPMAAPTTAALPTAASPTAASPTAASPTAASPTAASPTAVSPPSIVAPLTAVAPPAAPVAAPTPARVESDPPRTPRPRAEPRAPTTDELLTRVASLERQLRASAPKGEETDPASLRLLGSYRLKAELASTAAERLEVARKLDAFQRALP